MTLFVINVGNTGYSHLSLPLIEKLCKYNDINLYVLNNDITQNYKKLHPSWLKLFCHELINDDFIICWDLDLVPTKLFNLKSYFDVNNINMCVDWSLKKGEIGYNSNFRFNCGLIGIPKSKSTFFSDIYEEIKNPTYPSYEQYYVNDKIAETKTKVSLLDGNINYFFDGTSHYPQDVKSIHYTWRIVSNEHRINLINEHVKKYGKNF